MQLRLVAPFIWRVIRRFGEENFAQLSASLAFTTLLSVVPLAALVLALVAVFPALEDAIGHIDRLLVAQLLPAGSAGLIAEKIQYFSRRAAEVSGWGIAVLALAAFVLMNTVEGALNRAWRVRKSRRIWRRVALYAVITAIWPLFFGALFAAISSALTASLDFLGEFEWVRAPLFKALSFAALVCFFTLFYRVVPNAAVRWKHALIAGTCAAAGFLALQRGFAFYLSHFPVYKAIYGAFAVVPLFLLWVYLSWATILFGALIAALLPGLARKTPSAS